MPSQGSGLANLNLSHFAPIHLALFDLSALVCGFTDHFLFTLLPPSISVCGAFRVISYTTPSHLLQPDKLSTQTVAPDLAWSLPRDINDAVQRDNDALINIELFLFQPALFEIQALHQGSLAKAVRKKREKLEDSGNGWEIHAHQ